MDPDSPMVEMFTLFPHESAIVMRRGIELGILCSCLLVSHCVYLVIEHQESEEMLDAVLRLICIIRIVCAVPRPYFWFHTRKQFIEARYQPTPQLVSQRLLGIYANPFRIERALLMFYYLWLIVVFVLVCLAPLEKTVFANQLWRHFLFNCLSIILHRVVCVSLFYYLMHSDFNRGIPPDTLDKYTKKFDFNPDTSTLEDTECSICYANYEESDSIRQLVCGHHFHEKCVDVWLLGHQNKCPLCLAVVGPAHNPAEPSPPQG